MQLTLDIPDHCLPPQQDRITLAQQLKLYSALLLFQSGQLSRGAACEFAGGTHTFLAGTKKHKIPVINIETDDIEADLLRFERRHPV
jgi:hypothetical protein